MKSSLQAFRDIEGGSFFRETGTTFVFNPKTHVGATVLFTPTGAVELDLSAMKTGQSFTMVFTAKATITEKASGLVPSTFDAIGVLYICNIDGKNYASSGEDSSNVSYLESQVGDYDPEETGSTLAADVAALEAVVQEEGTPVTPIASTITTDLGGTNDIVFTAKTKGTAGDDIKVDYVLRPEITVQDAVPADLFTISLPKDKVDGYTIPTLTITQAATEAPFKIITLTKAAIAIVLGADADNNPIKITVSELKTALELDAGYVAAGYVMVIASGKDGKDVPEVAVTDMDSADGIEVDGTNIKIVLETTGGTISTDVADVISLIENDVDANALVSAVANASDDQAIDDVGSWQLANGVDGTLGEKGKILFDDNGVYLSVDESTVSESNWRGIAFVNPITLVDTAAVLSHNYDVVATDSHIVVTDADDDTDTVTLLPATGSGKTLTISNQDAAKDVVVTRAGSDTINGATSLTIGEKDSATLVDYAAGKWLVKK